MSVRSDIHAQDAEVTLENTHNI